MDNQKKIEVFEKNKKDNYLHSCRLESDVISKILLQGWDTFMEGKSPNDPHVVGIEEEGHTNPYQENTDEALLWNSSYTEACETYRMRGNYYCGTYKICHKPLMSED